MDSRYAKIKNTLLDWIKSGRYRPGDRIPPEAQLCTEFGVSRVTVARAIQDLAAQGYLQRRRGSGTFVHGGVMRNGLASLSSFSERMKYMPGQITTRVLEKSVISASEEVAGSLGIKAGDQVIYLKRLRYVDGVPLYIGVSYLRPSVFYWVMCENMEKNSLYDLLENKYGHKLGGAWQSISVGYLESADDCAALGISKDAPCLKIVILCSTTDGTPVQADVDYFKGDSYTYTQYINK